MTNELFEKVLSDLKDETQNWTADEHTLKNNNRGYEIWIANDPKQHLRIYRPHNLEFTQEQRDILIPLVELAKELNFAKLFEVKE